MNWRLYFILLISGIISVIAVIPYSLSLQGDILKNVPLPLPILLLISIVQNSVLFAALVFIGLKLSEKVGLGMPILEDYASNKKVNLSFNVFKVPVIIGVATGIAIILFDSIFTKLGVHLSANANPPLWQGFLSSFYGGIGEEVLLRLFFMTLIVWLLSKVMKSKGLPVKNDLLMWLSIIISAVVFGLGHLPITASLTLITPLVITRAVLLNGIAGVIFGWLYWKKGLESSMIAHFSSDLILHFIFPLILFL